MKTPAVCGLLQYIHVGVNRQCVAQEFLIQLLSAFPSMTVFLPPMVSPEIKTKIRNITDRAIKVYALV